MAANSLTINQTLSDDAILVELGQRLSRYRIDAGLTQQALADKAGISKSTLERIEAGAASQLPSLIRVLRALDMLPVLDVAIPPPMPRPMELLRNQRKFPQRVRVRQSGGNPAGEERRNPDRNRSRAPSSPGAEARFPAAPWVWGDERK